MLEIVPEKIKEIIYNRGVTLSELRNKSKMGEKPFNDVIEGKRVMPQFMMIKLSDLTGTKYKYWENLQNKELEDNNFTVGNRGLIEK